MGKKFAILGAGSWGSALAIHLAKNGHPATLWTIDSDDLAAMERDHANYRYLPDVKFPANLKVNGNFEEVVNGADTILVVVPSHAFKTTIAKLKPLIKPNQGVIWATKGLDPKSGLLLSDIATELLGKAHPIAVITGPSFAKEVAQGYLTMVLVAGNDPKFNKSMQAAFNSPYFRAYLGKDMIGAQLGGSVKNILAIAVGMADGMGLGTNTKSALMTRGLAEMMRLGEKLGAERETFTGLSGLGDLILTCSDNQSRNRQFGMAIGEGKNAEEAAKAIGQVVEGIQTTETIYHLAKKHGIDMPITTQMHRILYEDISAKDALDALMERKVEGE